MFVYSRLKDDMRKAGILVSDGEDLIITDYQLARDFLFHTGVNIGEEFHRYEEAIGAAVTEVVTGTEEQPAEVQQPVAPQPEPVPEPTVPVEVRQAPAETQPEPEAAPVEPTPEVPAGE